MHLLGLCSKHLICFQYVSARNVSCFCPVTSYKVLCGNGLTQEKRIPINRSQSNKNAQGIGQHYQTKMLRSWYWSTLSDVYYKEFSRVSTGYWKKALWYINLYTCSKLNLWRNNQGCAILNFQLLTSLFYCLLVF